MGPKKVPSASLLIKKARNTIEFTKELATKHKRGVRVADLARMYWKSASTINSILAKKKEIKETDVAKGVNVLTKQGSQTIEDVEKLLLVWIKEQQLVGDSVSEAIICKKAKLLHADLTKKMPGTSAAVGEFKASRGWFDKFKKQTGIHSVVRQQESSIKVKVMFNVYPFH